MHPSKRVLFLDLVLSVFRLNGLLIAQGDDMTEGLGLTHARWKVHPGLLAKNFFFGAAAQRSQIFSTSGVRRHATELE